MISARAKARPGHADHNPIAQGWMADDWWLLILKSDIIYLEEPESAALL